MVEAKKIAFEDRNRYLSDPEKSENGIEFIDKILSETNIKEKKELIQMNNSNNNDDTCSEGFILIYNYYCYCCFCCNYF